VHSYVKDGDVTDTDEDGKGSMNTRVKRVPMSGAERARRWRARQRELRGAEFRAAETAARRERRAREKR